MANNLQQASVYTDFSGLAELRRAAKKGGEDSIRAVAKQFEALFMQMVVKSMRDAMPAEGMFNSYDSKMYTDMYDKQLSLHLSQNGGFGLTEVLVRQLSGKGVNANVQIRKSLSDYINTSVRPVELHIPKKMVETAVAKPEAEKAAKPVSVELTDQKPVAGEAETLQAATPEDFVRFLWGYAKEAAKKYGLNAKAMVAQAALETGWGKHVMRTADGESSNNLYGIKAGNDWNGNRVKIPTLEFKDGVFRKESAAFRTYGSIAEAMEDYARFISSRPRYTAVRQHAENPELYVEHLQKAGYATDPAYADKIKKILKSGILENALNSAGI